jgi:type I restriction enzyme S subunit
VTQQWAHKALEELLSLNRSGYWGDETPSKARPIEVKVIRNADLTKHNSIKGSASRYFSPKEAANAELQIGDIAMSSSGDVGKAWLVNEPGYSASNFIRILRPNGNYIMPSFLRYVLESDQGQVALKASTAGTTIQNLQKTFYSMLIVPLPPLAEQQRIVRLLDEAFEGITTAKANAEKNLQNARALFDSQLESRFMRNNESWVSAQLNELVEIKHGFAFDGAHFSNQGEYVLLTPGNFHERGGYRDRGDKQKFFLGDIPTSFILHEGDLLVAMTEQAFGLLGSPIVLPGSAQFLHNQRLGLVVPNPGRALSRSFLYHLFNTAHVRKAIQSSASGVKVRHTSPGKIGAINVRFPESVSEQEDVAAALTALDHELLRLCALYERRLLAYELLTKAMLDEAFTDTGQAAA